MELSDLRKKPHLSASSISDYIECGFRYRFSRIDRLEPEYRSDTLVFGSAIHRTVAEFHQERMIGRLLPLSELQEIFVSHWREAVHGKTEIRYSKGRNFNVLLEHGKRLMRVYHQNFPLDGFNVLAIEEPFSFSIKGLPPIVGVFDLVEADPSGTIIVSDLKTACRDYSNHDISRNFQLTLYGMAAKATGYRDREILLRFDCLIKTKAPRFEQHYTARTETDERRAVSKMMLACEGIDKGVFIPNDGSWKCAGCGYEKECNRILNG
jgi:putative RecB family exonuclease